MADEEWTAAKASPPATLRAPPTAGADDELLADPPSGAPPGGLDGYKAGRPLRLVIVACIFGSIATAAYLVHRWREAERAAQAAPTLPQYTLSPEVDDGTRPRQLVWSDGVARLGLAREQPGVEEIVLPDRRLRLAPGHDIAQIKVEVSEGKTVSIVMLVGRIVELPPEGSQSPLVPVAKAR